MKIGDKVFLNADDSFPDGVVTSPVVDGYVAVAQYGNGWCSVWSVKDVKPMTPEFRKLTDKLYEVNNPENSNFEDFDFFHIEMAKIWGERYHHNVVVPDNIHNMVMVKSKRDAGLGLNKAFESQSIIGVDS